MDQSECIDCLAMACQNAECDWQPWEFKRRAPQDHDVMLDVHFCGVCHSDLHSAADHFRDLGLPAEYPFVAGHEISGIVTKVGSKVTRFREGDRIGIGCMVDSCRTCQACNAGNEHKCAKTASIAGIQTYGDPDRFGRAAVWPKGSKTKGGFSNMMVINEEFGIRIPMNYPLECVGPIMCSGITMFDPLVMNGAKAGSKVAFIGIGGLGGLGIKIARQMGCVVTAISRGPSKKAMAIGELGAHSYLDSKSAVEMGQAKGSFDLIINTIPIYHDINPYRALVNKAGKLVLIGLTPTWIAKRQLPFTTRSVGASLIGGIKRTEEVLKLCAEATPQITPKIVIKPVQELNSIFTFLDSGNDTGERFVLDIKGTLTSTLDTQPKPIIHPAKGMSIKTISYEWFKLMGCNCRKK